MKRFFKFAGIGCGGLIVLAIIVAVLSAVFGLGESMQDDGPTVDNSTPPTGSSASQNAPPPTRASTPTPQFTPTPTPAPTPTPKPLEVTAGNLYQAYEDNEVAAKATYENKTALITGTVASVTEAGNKYDVKLETDPFSSFVDVVCKVDKSHEAMILPLRRGRTITVLGLIKGVSFVDIVVENCTVAVLPPEPPEAPNATAAPASAEIIPLTADPTPVPTPAHTSTPYPTPTQAPTATPDPVQSATLPLSPSAQRIILDEIKAHPRVLDAAIAQDGQTLSLVLLVDYATNEEYAKQVGEDFVRLTMTFGAGISPGYPDLGPGKYHYLIGVYYPNETPVAEGAKVDFARRITW